MANFFRFILGGLIALGAIIVTLLVGLLVVIGTMFGLLASRFRRGGARDQTTSQTASGGRATPSPRHPRGAGEIIDVEVTDVSTDTPRRAASSMRIEG